MKIIHQFSKNFLESEFYQGETALNTGFLTANKKGDFASFFCQNQSRYQGWFFRNSENLYKIVEEISLENGNGPTELKNELWRHSRTSKIKNKTVIESFFLPERNRGLLYEIDQGEVFNVFLDFKPIYENSEQERFYKIEPGKSEIIIECRNKKDKIFLAIRLNSKDFSIREEWVRRFYDFDQKRNSLPFERSVFGALQIKASKMALGIGDSKKQAQKEANRIFDRAWELKKEKRKNIRNWLDFSKTGNSQISLAYLAAQNALRELIFENQNQKQISAGLPWFFEFWSRDAFISINSLMEKKDSRFWDVCEYYLSKAAKTGFLENKAGQTIKNADSTGWLLKRVGQAIEKGKVNEFTIWKIKKQVEQILEKTSQNKKDLSVLSGNGTWMDSINRPGERIELRAMELYGLKLAHSLTKETSYKISEVSLRFDTKEKFWKNGILFDSPDDPTIRPNIFLAYYIYPELLEPKEWQVCFDNALEALWLPWGGIATIDKNSPYFQPVHTGENSQSYHSGDSWFYLNNLTALVLRKINPERYRFYINKIIEASAKEILLVRAVGCHSELSSAQTLSGEGCWSQAWSNALFVELIRDILKNN